MSSGLLADAGRRPERWARAALAAVTVAVLTGIAAAGMILIGLANAD